MFVLKISKNGRTRTITLHKLLKRKTEAETHEREDKIQFEVKLLETRMTFLLK